MKTSKKNDGLLEFLENYCSDSIAARKSSIESSSDSFIYAYDLGSLAELEFIQSMLKLKS